MYLEHVAKVPAAEDVQIRRLASKVVRGRVHAKDELAETSQRTVLSLAVRFNCGGTSLMDLVQEGNIAVLDVIAQLASGAVKPSDFADKVAIAARDAMEAFASEVGASDDAVVIPAQRAKEIEEYQHARSHLLEEIGREPSDEEVAHRMNESIETVTEVRQFIEDVQRAEK